MRRSKRTKQRKEIDGDNMTPESRVKGVTKKNKKPKKKSGAAKKNRKPMEKY